MNEELHEIEKLMSTTANKKGGYVSNFLKWEQELNLKERRHVQLIKQLMVRQFLFPELAARVMEYEEINNLEDADIQCIIDSYEKSEQDITNKLVGGVK